MKGNRINPNQLLGIGFAVLAAAMLVLSLPILGVVSVALRVTLLVVAFAALIGGVIAYRVSPRFRSWFSAQLNEQAKYKGLRLRDGVALADGHAWARPERDSVVVGVDDFAQRVLGPVEVVELPEAGAKVWRGEPFVTLRRGSRRLELRSPVSGTVLRKNAELVDQPTQINSDPYGAGWALKVQENRPGQVELLREGRRARAWFHDEIDRLIETVEPVQHALPTMADGGVLIEDLYRVLDDATWRRVHRRFFENREREELS
jgi:glycine cleavage system H protein